jgi:hypothetical protein
VTTLSTVAGFDPEERDTERLLRQYALSARFRTLDALPLGVALDLQTRGVVPHFVCADRDLLPIAAAEGLSILDPEHL